MRRLFQRLFNNFWLKVLALALASMLSAYVYLDGNYLVTDTLVAVLRPKDLQQSLVIVEPLPFPKQVNIRVRGPLRGIRKLKANELKAYIDCGEQLSPGDGNFQVVIQDTDFGEVSIVSQDLERLYVRFDEKKETVLTVDIFKIGKVDPNFDIVSELVDPVQVSVSGPRPLVEAIASARVEPRLEGLGRDMARTLPVQVLDKEGVNLASDALVIEPAVVEYSIKLIPVGTLKVLKISPTLTGNLPRDLLLDRLTAKPVYVPVDANLVPKDAAIIRTSPINLTGATSSFTAMVDLVYPFELPQDTRLPKTCEVQVELVDLADLAAVRVEPELTGRNPKYDYIIAPPWLAVVSEELTTLDNGSKQQIHAAIAVDGLKPGEYRLTPQVTLPAGLSQFSLRPNALTVTIVQRGTP
jgi:YbbR domain-containing protein